MHASLADGRSITANANAKTSADAEVSAVFTGMDQGPVGAPRFDRPVVFESAVFEDGQATQTHGYTTWEDAKCGHEALVAKLTSV